MKHKVIMDARASLAAAPTCCSDDVRQIEFEPMKMSEAKRFAMDSRQQVFQFEWGKSYVKGIELGEQSKPYVIEIDSIPTNAKGTGSFFPGFGAIEYLFLPAMALLLDQNDATIDLVRGKSFAVGFMGSHRMRTTFDMDASRLAARKLIIIQEPNPPGTGFAVRVGARSVLTHSLAPEGDLEVTICPVTQCPRNPLVEFFY